MTISITPFLSETEGSKQLFIVRQVVDGHEIRQQSVDSMVEAEKVADSWKTDSSPS